MESNFTPAIELIKHLVEIQKEYSHLLKRLTLEERTKYKPQFLTDLVEEKKKTEDELISLSKTKALPGELFIAVHSDIQKSLEKRGLEIQYLQIEVPKLELSDLKVILVNFDTPQNLKKLKQDLLLTVTSDYRTDELYGPERIIRFKRKHEVLMRHSSSVLVSKYIRQNLRGVVGRLFPVKYDRNEFNSYFSQYIKPSHKFKNLHQELISLLNDYEDFIAGKEIRISRKKTIKNIDIPAKLNYHF